MLDTFEKYVRDIETLVDELEDLREKIRAKRRKNDEDLAAGRVGAQEVTHGARGTGNEIARVHDIKTELKQQYDGLFREIDEMLKEPSSDAPHS